jgi:hypothetical protein
MPREKSANDYQVGGEHYRKDDVIQHWDYAWSHKFDYFQGQITKYVTRWRKKNGVADLEKAKHFLEKYIEVVKTSPHSVESILQEEFDRKTKVQPGTVEVVSQEEYNRRVKSSREFQPLEIRKVGTPEQDKNLAQQPTGMHHPFGWNKDEDE